MIGLKPDIIWECTNNICKTTYVDKNISKVVDKKNNPLENLKLLKQIKQKFQKCLQFLVAFWIPWVRNDSIF